MPRDITPFRPKVSIALLLNNLYYFMASGGVEFDNKATSIIKSILYFLEDSRFNNGEQHDVLDVTLSLFTTLSAELNFAHSPKSTSQQNDTFVADKVQFSLNALENWKYEILQQHNSVIDDLFYGILVRETKCKECGRGKYAFTRANHLNINVVHENSIKTPRAT